MAKNQTTWANNISKKVTAWVRDNKANQPYQYDSPTQLYNDPIIDPEFLYDFRLPINELNNANLTVWVQS